MFPKNGRFKTPGIDQSISIDLQMVLWQLIDERTESGLTLDYMQVFELSIQKSKGRAVQRVLHRQEHPPFRQTIELPDILVPVQGVTVWIIDSGPYCTILLPDEY